MMKDESKPEEERLFCPYCDDEISESPFTYCNACEVTIFYCPDCRKPVPREHRICPHCGAEMAQKETSTAEKEKFTIVVFSGELDKALAAFMLATTAAAMGMKVSMFFTFWGLNIIKKNKGSIRSKGIMRKMLNFMNRGGSSRLKLSQFHMFGLGTWMIKRLMKDIKMPSIDEFIAMAKDMGVEIIACTTSCGLMGLPEDSFRSEVDSMAGAAYFLGEARESKLTLFI